MRKKVILIYLIIIVVVLIIAEYFFLYNIYGSEVRLNPKNLFADPTSEMTIQTVPINALGKKAIFRSSSAEFEIVEGADLIEVVEYNNDIGLLIIRSKGKAGLVGIKIKSEHSLLPEYIEIQVLELTS